MNYQRTQKIRDFENLDLTVLQQCQVCECVNCMKAKPESGMELGGWKKPPKIVVEHICAPRKYSISTYPKLLERTLDNQGGGG